MRNLLCGNEISRLLWSCVGPHPFLSQEKGSYGALCLFSIYYGGAYTCFFIFQLNYMTSQSLPNPKIELLIVHMTQNLSEKNQ
jgi:hypothetical protein